MLRLFCANYI